jgi:hypothetical protein
MFGRTNRTPVIKTGDLPVLPAHHTPEQLTAWRQAVAALPGPVFVPPRPADLDADPRATEAHRRAVLVAQEQEMQRQAEHMRTDPAEVAQHQRYAQLEVAQIDRMIGRLQARRAELNARIVLGTD